MPSTLSETSTWGSSVTIPSAGDLRNVSSVNTPIGTLANRTQRLKDSIPGRKATMSFRIGPTAFQVSSTARFTIPNAANPVWVQSDVGGVGSLFAPIVLPFISGTLDQIDLFITGGHSSTHSGLPVTMPRATLLIAGATATNVKGPITDTSASVPAYNALHPISLTGIGFNIDSTSSALTLLLEGENGTNSVANALALYYVVVTVTGSP